MMIGDLAGEARPFGERRRINLRALLGDLDRADRAAAGTRCAHGAHYQLDVLRGGAATSAHELHARVDQPFGVFGHVLRRSQVELTATDVAWKSGVRLRRKPP